VQLTHVTTGGEVHMVDVGDKQVTRRTAVAEAFVSARPETVAAIRDNVTKKGDVLAVARVAGIMAAKRTHELIPLCHPIPISSIEIELRLVDRGVEIQATVQCLGQTGVEMEALTAASVAGLTIYDMCKSIDRGMSIREVALKQKSGGRSGDWSRPDGDPTAGSLT